MEKCKYIGDCENNCLTHCLEKTLMENAKQKAIRLVYLTELSKDMVDKKDGLKFYNRLKKYIDENGWINANECNGTSGYLMESELDFNFPYLRLKSLQGIETNNGWIRIESEKDLPSESGDYYTIYDGDNDCFINEFYNNKWKHNKFIITHYQPIVKPLKPHY